MAKLGKEQEKKKFIRALVTLFNQSRAKEKLEMGLEITLFTHYQSSMGAAMTGSQPSYELTVSDRGLLVKHSGRIDEVYPFPADVKTWSKVIPYGEEFHDSSNRDYKFKPATKPYIENIGKQLGI